MNGLLKAVWCGLRSGLFFGGALLAGILIGTAILPLAPFLSFPQRYSFLLMFPRFLIWWLQVCCGVRFCVLGMENVPDNAVLLCSRHESPWETFFLPILRRPRIAVSIAKKELLYIPFFGWGAALAGHILIQRDRGLSALKIMLKAGGEHLRNGHDVIIFPEGTRSRNRRLGSFKKGAVLLAQQENAALVPIAHNAAECWPAGRWAKWPGTITVLIGRPIPADQRLSAPQLTEKLRQSISELIDRLPLSSPETPR